MTEILRRLRDGWEKTWPDVHCALHGGLPDFVLDADPQEIGAGVPVFCYHDVDPDAFEADLAFLRRNGYGTITADALADHLEGRAPAPSRSVVLTFDDGLRSLFDTALPRLREHGLTGVAFIAPWFHENAGASDRVCTWDHIERMHESGCLDFQSHTYQHRFVPRWPEPVAMIGMNGIALRLADGGRSMSEDFELAMRTIERRLGKSVRHLAFPRYQGTAESVRLGLAAGHRAFWWGGMAGRPLNRPGDPLTHIVRMRGAYLRRLPGDGRVSLHRLLQRRCSWQMQSIKREFLAAVTTREAHQ